MLKEVIIQLSNKQDLTQSEAYGAMSEIMSGEATDAQIAAFLMGLRLKGETVEEIAGCANVMREKAVRISTKHKNVIDTCGTGGDASGTFNISTTAAIIASAGGAVVAKHGNRAVSSRCGSADVLKALGINLDVTPEKSSNILDETGITFLFAPLMHGAMKYAANVRRELSIRTLFNILGPLTNPAGAQRQVLGVFHPALTETLAGVLKELGSHHALVVHGEGGFDELSTAGWTKISELKNGSVNTYEVQADQLGFKKATVENLKGGDPVQNAAIVRRILEGKDGPTRDIALLNSGAALFVAGKAASLREGITLAAETVDSGAAKRKLKDWVDASNS
ncbi:MAG TPA: anthranilate phosphoribosyltransferase [Bacteroidota bacterium]